MRKMNRTAITRMLALVLAAVPALVGCQAETVKASPNFSGYESIAELSTIECYYHNVAMFNQEADSGVFGIMNHGYKKAWFEYSGIVRMGIDAYKVSISDPDENNVVTVAIPYARLIGDPDVDESSITEPLVETGWLTELTAEDKLAMFAEAQQKMRDAAESDDALLAQARTRAKDILEQYVKSVGKQIGQDYTVNFVDAS